MSYKFKPKNHTVEVEFEGGTENLKFNLECTAETNEYIRSCAPKLRKTGEAIGKQEKTTADAIALGCEIIEHLLGDGACEKLFAIYSKTFDTIFEICIYLMDICKRENEKRFEELKLKK